MIFKRGLLPYVLPFLTTCALAQTDPQRDFVVTDKDAYFILPQEFVCGPQVQQVSWSPDGDRLAILRMVVDLSPAEMAKALVSREVDRAQIEPEYQIAVWSAVSHKLSTLLKVKASKGVIHSMQWIAGSSSMIIQGTSLDTTGATTIGDSTFILNGAGQTVPITPLNPGAEHEFIPSPSRPTVMLMEHPGQAPTAGPSGDTPVQPRPALPAIIRFFGTDGVMSQPIAMPGPRCIPEWSSNGQPYVLSFERKPNQKKVDRVWYLLDRASHTLRQSNPPDADTLFNSQDVPEIQVQDLSPKLSGIKVGVNAPTVVLSSTKAKDPELSVVSTDGSRGELSPRLNAVSYQSQASLMVRAMVKVSLEDYKRAKTAALRVRLINQAKQVALGLIMYGADYDDVLPMSWGSWKNDVQPYLKDQSLTDGFNLAFGGGNMASVQDPANTILGYIDGPGGRAVAYLDGHVKWIPNP